MSAQRTETPLVKACTKCRQPIGPDSSWPMLTPEQRELYCKPWGSCSTKGLTAVTHNIDRLNEALRDAEDALAELGLGVAASVSLGEHELHYFKRGARWGLFVRLSHGDEVPILSAAKAIRVAAADRLDDLEGALRKASDDQEFRIIDAIKKARDFAERLRMVPR